MNSKQTKPSIVFAHGLWADGSCFSKLIPTLQAEGHEVVAAQNSLDTLKGDVATVTRALGRVRSPTILVGHSYGGTVITACFGTLLTSFKFCLRTVLFMVIGFAQVFRINGAD